MTAPGGGSVVGTGTTTLDFVCPRFTVESESYTDIQVSWDLPSGAWDYQRLVRNSLDVPVDVTDGQIMFTQLNTGVMRTSYADLGLTSGRRYYYALFVFDHVQQFWRRSGFSGVLLAKKWGYTRRIYDLLPEVMKTQDYNSLDNIRSDEEQTFLYRYLDIFGYQLDYLRTETEGLRSALDARKVSSELLPSLAASVGIKYEPTVNARSLRRLVQNAVHLYRLKGTALGVRELANIVTGWGAVVYRGVNLALDDLDAGPSGSQGRWHGRSNAVVTYVADLGAPTGLPGTGSVHVDVAPGVASAVIDMNYGLIQQDRLKYAIPVTAGTDYVASAYVRSASPLQAALTLTYLDAGGVVIGSTTNGAVVSLDDTGTLRPFATAHAPAGAVYLEAGIVITPTAATTGSGQSVSFRGFQVQTGSVLTPWQPSRLVIVKLYADLVNEIIYPTPAPNSSGPAPWSADAGTAPQIASSPTGDDAFETVSSAAQTTVTPSGPALAITPGSRYQFNIDVQSTVAGGLASLVALTTLSDASVVQTVLVDPTGFLSTGWTSLVGQYTAPTNAASVRLLLVFTGANGQTVYWRRAAIIRTTLQVDYFDGGTRSMTQDVVWEGIAYASRTHLYHQRSVRSSRLRKQLVDYLPNGLASVLQFASPN